MPPVIQTLFGDPNLVYLILVAGIWTGALALVIPGTGALEVFSIFCLLAAGYAALSLPINPWALLFLLLGAACFLAAVWRPRIWYLLVGSSLLLTLSSMLLFRGEGGAITGVSWPLAVAVSVCTIGFFWLAVYKTRAAHGVPPTLGFRRLIGEVGQVVTEIKGTGTVQVASELWSARAKVIIPAGLPVVVVGHQGFALLVEPQGSEGLAVSERTQPSREAPAGRA